MQATVTEEPQVNRKRLTLSLYLNYLIHGFGLIILAQNMVALGGTWSVPVKTVSFVISGVGIGRLISYLITGTLADLFSRKLLVNIGMFSYLIFAVGMIMTHSVQVAYCLTILAGIANSALDAGTYTTLVEMNNGNGYDTILIKGFMSIGEFILPLIIATLNAHNLWLGWSFIIMAVLLVINIANVSFLKFPVIKTPSKVALGAHVHWQSKLRAIFSTIVLLAYGYTSMALMIWFTQWITLFTQRTFNFGNLAAHTVMSCYSIGSMAGVITLFFLLKHNASELKLLISLNLVAVSALIVIMLAGQNVLVANAASFVFGLSAASGVMQTGLTVFMNMFPAHRGMITGIFYFFGSIASFTVPLITGVLSTHSISTTFGADIIVGIIGTMLMIALAFLQKEPRKA